MGKAAKFNRKQSGEIQRISFYKMSLLTNIISQPNKHMQARKLVEICVKCGFVHRDDRTNTRQRKPHYHWYPTSGEEIIMDCLIHATICCACTKKRVRINWEEYAKARNATSDEFYIMESYNASLPSRLHTKKIDKRYIQLVNALEKDWQLTRSHVRHLNNSN